MDPEEITVIVHGARNLQGRKKGRHKYSVIFGLGSRKFRTQVVSEASGNPDWVEESVIPVDNPVLSLSLVVTEKEDVLGQVTIPLNCMPGEAQRWKKKYLLQAHKKCPEPQGELFVEAWVSKSCPKTPTIMITTSEGKLNPLNKMKDKLSPLLGRKQISEPKDKTGSPEKLSKSTEKLPRSPLLRRKFHADKEKSKTHAFIRRRNSKSLEDVRVLDLHVGTRPLSEHSGTALLSVNEPPDLKRANSAVELSTVSSIQPEITGVYPNTGPVTGGTRISILGHNLGKNKEDVVGMFICGANCLGKLEYESPTKLYVTTKPWKICTGCITMETQSGGRTASTIQFSFVEQEDSRDSTVNEVNNNLKSRSGTFIEDQVNKDCSSPEHKKSGFLSRLSGSHENKKDKDSDASSKDILLVEIKSLKEENKVLHEENSKLKLYIDELVARVIEVCPEALSVDR